MNLHSLEEADEAVGWLEVLMGAEPPLADAIVPLLKEAREIMAILSASRVTASRNQN